jgi:hypothetical protein
LRDAKCVHYQTDLNLNEADILKADYEEFKELSKLMPTVVMISAWNLNLT